MGDAAPSRLLRLLRPLAVAAILLLLSPSMGVHAQLSSEAIVAAQRYSATHNGIALIVQERGQLRYENYYNGYRKGEPLHIYSGTKSFFGVLGVMAQEDGLLNLDERAAETLVEWRDDPRRREITIRDLLNFTSGLETGFQKIYGRGNEDKIALAVGLKAVHRRGESFIYGPGHLNAFAEVLRRKLASRGLSYDEYLQSKLTRPLGIRIERWREDGQGNPVPSAGMHMTAQEWMKLGQLVNSGGRAGARRLVGAESLAQCFAGTEINPSFGLGFWLNGHVGQPGARVMDVEVELDRNPMPEDWRGAILSPHAPPDLAVSLGSNFQRMYLVPSMDLIVMHHGSRGKAFRDAEFLRLLFEGAALPETKGSEPQGRGKGRSGLPGLFEGLRRKSGGG